MKVTRTLQRGVVGTSRMAKRFGDELVCVRYRVDDEARKRFKTVEVIVEEMSYVPSGRWRRMQEEVLVPVHRLEYAIRDRVRAAGGRWDSPAQAFRLPRYIARHLGLESRITGRVQRRSQGKAKPVYKYSDPSKQ